MKSHAITAEYPINFLVRLRLASAKTPVNDGLDDGAVTMQRFDGGYFDASGRPQYYLTDWQGSVTGVADDSGSITQSVNYYPDGEPWLEPSGDNRFLFAGKERLDIGGLNLYDFGPRLYNAAGCFWYLPDPAAASYPHISPYSYCAGNPVRYTDPTGMVIVCKGSDADIQYTTNLISQLREHKIFDDVFSVIDASETEYTICWGYPTLPDGKTPADACFDPNNNTITFSRELKKHKGATIMSVCEELYHVYQKTVPTPELTVNEEYEAKTFAVIENVSAGEGYIYKYHGLGAIYDTINMSFLDETNTKFVYRSNFPECYVDGGVVFLQHHINNTVPAYKVPILSMPSRLIDVLSKH